MMVEFEQLLSGREAVSVVGLGYVGLPLARALSRVFRVVGYDCDRRKIARLQRELGGLLQLTSREEELAQAKLHIIAVPTPVTAFEKPDLTHLAQASESVGRQLSPGSVVVYESTVYPGATEEFCLPILERSSGFTCGEEFTVGYSPERINPGDGAHRLETVVKVVSGCDCETAELLRRVYGAVVTAGIHCAPSIRVAEAAKVVENVQRDLNIAVVNELSHLFEALCIDTGEVLAAARTKWNFAPYRPGLVGGHCIGVDTAYLLACAELCGCSMPLLRAGRRVNREMGRYVACSAAQKLREAGVDLGSARAAVAGFTFKEDCPDIRNTRVEELAAQLERFGIEVAVCDPCADPEEVLRQYGRRLVPFDQLGELDALVFAVGHRQYRALSPESVAGLFRSSARVVIDVDGIFERRALEQRGCLYWRL